MKMVRAPAAGFIPRGHPARNRCRGSGPRRVLGPSTYLSLAPYKPMHCIHCGYLLFNLPRPVCPECGLPFDVCAYRFEPQVVHFACPACDQEYAGNDQRGLPWPR
ncbi:MAG: hypothetical protein ACYS7M_03745, partial [Planctomycetota bacterium]